jgi:hypothetical protein
MKEIWILYVMFAYIGAYENPGPKDVVFKNGPMYVSSEECDKYSSKWIMEEITRLDFKYDWKLAVCSDGNIDVYKYPVQVNNKSVQINYNALFNGNSLHKSGAYKTGLRETNF